MKIFLFWIWLWQWKEYHFGRVKAYFETRPVEKFASAFLRVRTPKFTKKAIVISFTGLVLAYIIGRTGPFWLLLFALLLSPLIASAIILFFQIPTVIWRDRVLRKARKKRDNFKDLLVIGITGSYGKTSTKEILATILSEKFKVLKTKEHQNTEIGIARTILNDLNPEHEIFVVEMGAYNKGGIKLLCDIVNPKIGVLTGINEQHMSTFGSQENIIKTKYELIESLPEDGIAFFNEKNEFCRQLCENEKTKIVKKFYGKETISPKEENLAGAVAVAEEVARIEGSVVFTQEEIEKEKQKIRFSPFFTKKGADEIRIKKPGEFNIINASYSANPTGVMADLDFLKEHSGKKILIMPCLIELGKSSKEVHRKIGKKIAEVCDLAIIVTKDRFKEIKEGAGDKAIFMCNPNEIIKKLEEFNKEEDIVLLEGRVPKKLIDLLMQ